MDDFFYVVGRGTAYGLPLLENLLRLSSTAGVSILHGVARGHQHNNAAGMCSVSAAHYERRLRGGGGELAVRLMLFKHVSVEVAYMSVACKLL